MYDRLHIAYFAHSLRSDWNNGNVHFLRGLIREIGALGHDVSVFEPRSEWSMQNLLAEAEGKKALAQFEEVYPEICIREYEMEDGANHAAWQSRLHEIDLVVMHEWNPPAFAQMLLELRDELGYRLLFHDTHHRATSSPEKIRLLGVDRFDGIIVFGDALRNVYRSRFGIDRVWTLHEAADTAVFRPLDETTKRQDVVWIGNWGDEERSQELREFLLRPAAAMRERRFEVFGVRYPKEALNELHAARARFGGYLPNLEAPRVYSESRLTLHVPRQQYVRSAIGIPTIRVFEALACGIPLLSAPWVDTEGLFREGDMTFAQNGEQMRYAIERMLDHPEMAQGQAARGRETVLARHTCAHRAAEFEEICGEVLQ